MAKHPVTPNMRGANRPQLSCDNLGYPISVGDAEWNSKHRKNYVEVPGGWHRKCNCCDTK
jgi:hypothetical protein